MAASMRRTNHWPTMARLITDSALCPIVRVSVVHTASPATVVVWLMNMTTTPSATATLVSTTRLPKRSIVRPIPSAPTAPIRVAQKLIVA